MTDVLDELQEWLDDAGVSAQFHPSVNGWCVWIYASEDGAILVTAEGITLASAIERAKAKWRGATPPAPPEGTVMQ